MAVVSDHGFVPYHVEIELGVLLRNKRLLDITADESVRSWRAAAWTAGGTAAIVLRDSTDASARQMVEHLISEVAKDPKYGIARVYGKPEISELQGFSNADFVLALKPGFKFGRKLHGPVLVPRTGGTHGYLPMVQEMDAAFFIVGPGITRGRSLGRIRMRDVAPTLASILSLELPRAEGVDVLSLPRAPTGD
jgi:predicted AlkP superfamily pyrophosphatase or phosphodiesterase